MSKEEFEKQPTASDRAFAQAFREFLDEWGAVPAVNQTAVILNAIGWQLQALNAELGHDADDLMKMVEYNMNAGGEAYRSAHGIKAARAN